MATNKKSPPLQHELGPDVTEARVIYRKGLVKIKTESHTYG